MNKINFLPPWVETNLQPAFYDVESGTVLQQVARMYAKVNQLVRNVNDQNIKIEEYVQKFIELKDFVDNYFDNLDVQEEINNKLDEMADDGTLQEIVGAYLNANAVWGFDNIADMKSSSNLIDGSFARTLGYHAKNDGGGATYKIRAVTNQDVEDNAFIIALDDETLVAELIIADNIVNVKVCGAYGDDDHDDTTAIQTAVDKASALHYPCYIPAGTYQVSKVSITSTVELYGNPNDSIIKSIEDNVEEALIYVLNAGVSRTSIHDIKVDGNSSNVASNVDGIKMYVNSATYATDQYANLYNIIVDRCAGNAISLESTQSSAFREMRIDNITVNRVRLNGFNLTKMTDSIITRCTASVCNHYGYYLPSGGSNKLSGCKAFWCGSGDGTTPDYERAPASAFEATSDETPQAGKTYYTRSGTGAENDYYEFSPFSGESFDGGTTYYEMTTLYPVRYQGFYISNTATMLNNCEAQDNYGDGFYLSGSQLQLSNVDADNNGLITVDGNPVSYSSQSKDQCYYGFFIKGCWELYAECCTFLNHRNSSIGKSQRASAYIRGGGDITVKGTQGQQVVETIVIQKVSYPNGLTSTLNNKEWVYNIPLSKITMLDQDLVWQGEQNCLFYYKNNTVYYRLIVKKTGGILNSWHEVSLFKFPSGYRPKKYLPRVGLMTDNSGYSIYGSCSLCIYENGNVTVRNPDNSLDSYEQMVIEGQFTTD